MGTSSIITAAVEPNKFAAIYVHFDGYVEGVGKTLFNHYRDLEKIKKLFERGSLSGLEKTPEESFAYRDRGEDRVDAIYKSSYEDLLDAISSLYDDSIIYHWNGEEWSFNGTPLSKFFYTPDHDLEIIKKALDSLINQRSSYDVDENTDGYLIDRAYNAIKMLKVKLNK